MESFISYFSLIALILVLILLTWAIVLMYNERSRKFTARTRLSEFKKKIEAMPDESDEDKVKKELLHRELSMEYLDSILAAIEKVQATLAKKSQEAKQAAKVAKNKSKGR
jgi:hypothetical protein